MDKVNCEFNDMPIFILEFEKLEAVKLPGMFDFSVGVGRSPSRLEKLWLYD